MKKISRTKRNRNKRIKEYIKLILNTFILLLKTILELLVYLIRNLIKIIYKVIYKLNTIIGKLFMKLPRPTKTLIIYVLVLTFILDLTGIIKDKKIISFSRVDTPIISYVEPRPKEVANQVIKEVEVCKFDEISCKIYSKAKSIGMNEEQTLISIAISRWETGNYTSSAFKEKNNVGGMMCNSGLINYSSLDEGIEKFLINLKNNYFDIGLNTIEKIQKKYCPVGAANDPSGLNKYWLGGVTDLYNELNK